MSSLGERALAISLAELQRGAGETPPGSNAGPDVAKYFVGCMRDSKPLGLTSGEWCAAAACWAMHEALEEGEEAPHPWRASGIELQQDAMAAGSWRAVGAVASGFYDFAVGDLAIYSRGGWRRHVCRVESIDRPRFRTIGGNEGNRWELTWRSTLDPGLLGFVRYPQPGDMFCELIKEYTDQLAREIAGP